LAFLSYIDYDEGGTALRREYERLGAPERMPDNILRIHSLNPPSMGHHLALYAHLMRGPSPLTRAQREMIAVTVSAVNDCFY